MTHHTQTTGRPNRKLNRFQQLLDRNRRRKMLSEARTSNKLARLKERTSASPYTRYPAMKHCVFRRMSATYQYDGSVTFSVHSQIEEIIVASDWKLGVELCRMGKDWTQTGYIASGFSKTAIYARYKGREYVLTTLSPENSHLENLQTLRAEFQLLCSGQGFKTVFQEYAESCGVKLPPFDFNFRASLLGEIVQDVTACILPHRHFLATPLLPCGAGDALPLRFTGSDNVGPAPDLMTRVIHAFAHFSLVYSGGRMLFSDLQGLHDKNGVLCLIDPECHTNNTIHDRFAFWDCGPRHIQRFVDQHISSGMCEENPICSSLRLASIRAGQIRLKVLSRF